MDSRLTLARSGLALTLLAAPAASQSLSVVASEGDFVPGVGLVTSIDRVVVADDGSVLIEVDTDHPNTDADRALLLDGSVFLREDDALPAPAGARVDRFNTMSLLPGGVTVLGLGFRGPFPPEQDTALFVAGQLVVQEGDVTAATGFTPGTTHRGFFDVKFGRDQDSFLCVLGVDDAAIPGSFDQALVRFDRAPGGGAWTETEVVKSGDFLPGQPAAVSSFETGPHEVAFDSVGGTLFSVRPAGAPVARNSIHLGATMLMRRGEPSPVPGRDWGGLANAKVDVNASRSWVVKTVLDGTDTSTDDVIVRDGAIYRRAGDTLPAIAPFTLQDFGGGGVWITDLGDVVWIGDWNDPSTFQDEGLFINDRLVLQEGVTQVDGLTITSLRDLPGAIQASPSGRYIVIEASAIGPSGEVDVAIRIDTRTGSGFCASLPNSTGAAGSLIALGSAVAADNDLALLAGSMPPGQFGIFVASTETGNVPTGGGILCLGGAVGRFNQPAQIRQVRLDGTFGMPIDLTAIPTPNAFVSVMAGDTYYFQAWHRDGTPAAPSSNLTNGLRLDFQ